MFNIALQLMIKLYKSVFHLTINAIFFHKTARKTGEWSAPDLVASQNGLMLWIDCLATYSIKKLLLHRLFRQGRVTVDRKRFENALL